MANKRYHSDIVIEYIKKFPNATTSGLSRKIFNENKLDFTSYENVRSLVRNYRGERKKTTHKTVISRRTDEQKRMAMANKLPESDYTKIEPFTLPKGQNNILILSDIHFPYQDNKALQLALEYGLEHNVNTIYLNGDILDFYQCSRFTKDRRLRDFAGEIEMGREFLRILKETFDCPIYYKIGNHEKRYEDYLMLRAPELLGVDDFKLAHLLRFGELGVHLIEDKQIAYAGKLPILHGHEWFGGFAPPVNPARGLYMKAKESAIVGHHHRTSEHTEKSLSGEVTTTWSMGCLCGLEPSYAPYNNYNHGFAHVKVSESGNYQLKNIRIIDYKIV